MFPSLESPQTAGKQMQHYRRSNCLLLSMTSLASLVLKLILTTLVRKSSWFACIYSSTAKSVGYPVTKTSSWAPSFKTYPQVSLSCHSYIPRDQWMLRVLTIPRVFLMWSWAGTVPSPRIRTIPGAPGSGPLVTEFLTLELYLCLLYLDLLQRLLRSGALMTESWPIWMEAS